MLTLVIGTDWKANRNQLMQMIGNDVASEKPNRIFMVPELVSHQTERELADFAGDTTSRFAEVLSFQRLANRVADSLSVAAPQCLDNGGRIIAMASATRQLHSQLKAYASVETKPEFLSDLIEAVDEFKRCCITASDLMTAANQTEGLLSQKITELAMILDTYDGICSRSKLDPREQMTWLYDQLEDSDFAESHTFYFDAFPDLSRQQMEIVLHLIQHSPNVTISFQCDSIHSRALAYEKAAATALELYNFANRSGIAVEILEVSAPASPLLTVTNALLQGPIQEGIAASCLQVYQTSSVYEECVAAVEKILSLVQNGCRYRDIRLVCADISRYKGTLQNVLERAHIPSYLTGTDDLLSKTVIQGLLTALDTALGGFYQKDMLRYLRSILSPLDMDLCDRLENYVITWGIDGNRWTTPWENHPKGLGETFSENDLALLEQLNQGREKVVTPLVHLQAGFRSAVGVGQQVKTIYEFLCQIRLEQKLQSLAEEMTDKGDLRSAQILNQLWEILINALDQLYSVLGETTWETETFTRLFKLLLSQYDVGTIPSVLDAVSVGDMQTLRCEKTPHLLLLGASEGALPSYAIPSGVLNDSERSTLIGLGMTLNPGTLEVLQTQFSEIQQVFCGAESSITVSYSEGQPSYIYDRLRQLAGGESSVKALYGAALTDPWECAAYLVACKGREAADRLGISDSYRAVETKMAHTIGNVEGEHIQALYRGKLDLSATQIDRLADCRLSYFLRYGLAAKERKSITIDPAEFGSYVHSVLENCGRKILSMGGFKKVTLEQTHQIASELSAQYFAERFDAISTDRIRFHFDKNTKELQLVVEELWKELQESDFQPVAFELDFGDGKTMPAIQVHGAGLKAQLGGYVDRVDSWRKDGKLYLRVVDYKTGAKDFDYCDIYNGIGLQMLLYLFALEDEGKRIFNEDPNVAGVQYFPARIPIIKADGSLSVEAAAIARQGELRRKGLILSEEDVIFAMENSDNPVRLCCDRGKDGSLLGDIASVEQFKKLKAYIFLLLRRIVDDVASGNVTPNPYTRGNEHNACRFCPYKEICKGFQNIERRNYKKTSADRFWADIEKEV